MSKGSKRREPVVTVPVFIKRWDDTFGEHTPANLSREPFPCDEYEVDVISFILGTPPQEA